MDTIHVLIVDDSEDFRRTLRRQLEEEGIDPQTNIAEQYSNVDTDNSEPIKKGAHLGGFAYGGSLVILLFEKDVFSSINIAQGAQLGPLNEIRSEPRRLRLW